MFNQTGQNIILEKTDVFENPDTREKVVVKTSTPKIDVSQEEPIKHTPISAAAVGIPTTGERLVVIKNTPMRVVDHGPSKSGNELVYTVEKVNEEPILVVVNLEKGLISTKESTTKFTSLVANRSNQVSFTAETTKQAEELFALKPIDKQIEKKSNHESKVRKVVLAVLFAMMGSTAIQFHQNAVTNAVSCPSIPDFQPLIPPGPFNFSNYEQLELYKPLYSKATLQLKMEKNKADFFHGELGGENAQTKQILKDIQHQKEKAARDEKIAKELLDQARQVITNLKRELKDAEQATKYWQERSDSHFTMQKFSEDSVLKAHFQLENAKKTIVSITEEINRLTGNYTEQLSDAKTQLSNIINKNDANQKVISDLEGLIKRLSRTNQILDDENVAMSKYYLEQIENLT
ncbi:hypothetical protein BDK51DRAFT_36752 [Blyttiomyces helicus]|uniref:Uncharacterized protein n=1 Tax=Blyttiomyces helicus TaxID=388810 RepID=A0A4P9WE89_9FUNG|nr:hypothetical protein BDK51DRAFT_36752 [Blyttiomyces helicus]|eukprot:RKO89568.1 hypothetical protein BDK51DRAFT_36752 [Blyttiomyces helicus]